MIVHFQLFLFFIVATCRAHLLPQNRQLLVPDVNMLRNLRSYQNEREIQFSQRLAQIDRVALSKVSEADRQLLLSKLTQAEREALLTQFEDGQLDEVLPREETRFGFGQSGGIAGAAAQIGAGAGGYIGGKLAGALGAKLGAAAGAYLGAAAASRFDFSGSKNKNAAPNADSNGANNGVQYGGSFGGNYGAVLQK